jgi:hypothetical protein
MDTGWGDVSLLPFRFKLQPRDRNPESDLVFGRNGKESGGKIGGKWEWVKVVFWWSLKRETLHILSIVPV